MNRFVVVLVPGLLAGLSGCASVINGSTELVTVQTQEDETALAGAQCALNNEDGSWTVTTPESVKVHRAVTDLEIKCTRSGYQEADQDVASSTSGALYGNILAGGLIGANIDENDGAAYEYPQTITVSMNPAPPAPPVAAVPPAADPAVAAK